MKNKIYIQSAKNKTFLLSYAYNSRLLCCQREWFSSMTVLKGASEIMFVLLMRKENTYTIVPLLKVSILSIRRTVHIHIFISHFLKGFIPKYYIYICYIKKRYI